jgi:DNA-binding phage protein
VAPHLQDLLREDPEFRAAQLAEAIEFLAENDVQTAKSIIRKYILASIGFEALAKQIDKKPKSIKRMLSEKGNPTLKTWPPCFHRSVSMKASAFMLRRRCNHAASIILCRRYIMRFSEHRLY